MPLSILYYTLHDLALPSGPTSHVRAVVKRLEERGHRVTIIGTTSDARATDDLPLIDCGAFITTGGLIRKSWRVWKAARLARNFAKQLALHSDVLYARHLTAGAVIPHQLPLVFELNGDPVEEMRNRSRLLGNWYAWITARNLRQTLQRAQHVVTVTRELRELVCERYGLQAEHVSTVANGVDTQTLRPVNGEIRARIRREWGCPLDAPVAAIVGNLGPRQRVDWLLSAWPTVLEEFPDARVVLIGPGLAAGGWARLACERGLSEYVICRDPVPERELSAVYAGIDVALQLVATSSEAGRVIGSLKARSAFAAGRPIVATRHPDLIFVEANALGRLIPEADPQALAEALITLFADGHERSRMGACARRYAEASLDWKITVAAIEPLLQKAVAMRGSPRPAALRPPDDA